MNLFIIPSWYPTKLHPEAGSFFAGQARMFSRAGHTVRVLSAHIHSLTEIVPYLHTGRTLKQTDLDWGLPVLRYEALNRRPGHTKGFFRFYQSKISHLFDQALEKYGRPDFVLINSSLWAGTALADKLSAEKVPFIINEHLKEFLNPDSISGFQRELIAKAYTKAAGVVAVSSALQSGLAQLVPSVAEKMTVIPNPVDTEFFKPDSTGRQKPAEFTFICIALLRREKNLDLLLQAWSELTKELPGIRLKIVGDGPERKRLLALRQKLGLENQVEFIGYLPAGEVRAVLNAGQALVLPSTVETFGMAIIEAQACGLPAVATRCGGPEDIITHATGILVEKDSPEELSAGMREIHRAYDRFNHTVIRQTTEQRFGIETFLNKYNELFTAATAF